MTPPRLQILSLYASYGFAGIFWGALAASVPGIQARSGLSASELGLAFGVMSLAALPVMFAFGRVIARIAPLAIPLTMLTFSAGALALAHAAGGPSLILALAILGASSGALDIALNMRTARVEEDTGARLFNRVHAVFPLAMLAGSAATGALRAEGIGLVPIFTAVALLLATGALTEGRAGRHQGRATGGGRRIGTRLPPVLLLLGLIAALGAFQEAAPQGWAALYVETVREGGAFLAGLAPAAYTLGLSAGRLLAHEVEARLSAMATVRIAAALAIPSFAALALPVPVAALLVLYFLAGMGVGPIEPAVFRSVARRAPEDSRGPMLASVTAIAYLGYLLSPPVLGQVPGTLGWPALWGVAACAAALVIALTFAVGRR